MGYVGGKVCVCVCVGGGGSGGVGEGGCKCLVQSFFWGGWGRKAGGTSLGEKIPELTISPVSLQSFLNYYAIQTELL